MDEAAGLTPEEAVGLVALPEIGRLGAADEPALFGTAFSFLTPLVAPVGCLSASVLLTDSFSVSVSTSDAAPVVSSGTASAVPSAVASTGVTGVSSNMSVDVSSGFEIAWGITGLSTSAMLTMIEVERDCITKD